MAKGFAKAAANWKARMQTAGTAYSDGIDAVTQSPMEAAANAKDAYAQGVNEAVASGRYERGLRRVSMSDWKKAAKEKGASRLASGANAAAGKVEKFFAVFGPKLMAITEQVRAMPKGTFEERQQRAIQMMNATHALKGDAY